MILSPASESKLEFSNKYFEHYVRKWNNRLHMLYAVLFEGFTQNSRKKPVKDSFVSKELS